MQPRVLRPSQAAAYLGMGRTLFERLIKPTITAYKLGEVGIGYDRLELDAAWEHYKQRNQAGPCNLSQDQTPWQNEKSPVFTGKKPQAKGELKKTLEEQEFASALQRTRKQKPKASTTKP